MKYNVSEILKPTSKGGHKIEVFEIEKGNLGAMIQGIMPGKYVRLKHSGEVVMSNTNMEWRTNMDFICRAHGDVLIGGLGIGMIILEIQDDPAVRSITVVEKYRDVIEIVRTQLPFNEKVSVICGDVFEFKPDRKFDCIYMDVWNWVNSDVYEKEMKPLKRKYGHFLKPTSESPKRFNECWAEYQAKRNMRLS